MIFPYDSNGAFSDPEDARPTQRPASNSESRKRDHSSGLQPVDGAFGQELAGLGDPHLDNGFAEVIRKAKAKGWDAGYCDRWNDARTGHFTRNPYGSAS